MKNEHGLDRAIPAAVKRKVRIRCGFGCAICGATIYEYEHFFPDFKDAAEHDPNSIVLLCPNHHAEVTKGVIPKKAISEASENPRAKTDGFSYRDLPWFEGFPTFKVGGSICRETPIPFSIMGEFPIVFAEPEESSKVTQISAVINDPEGRQILSVTDNEWRVSADAADFEWVGNRYTFKDAAGSTILQMRFQTPDLLVVEKMLSKIKGVRFEATEEYIEINGQRMPVTLSEYCGVGFGYGPQPPIEDMRAILERLHRNH